VCVCVCVCVCICLYIRRVRVPYLYPCVCVSCVCVCEVCVSSSSKTKIKKKTLQKIQQGTNLHQFSRRGRKGLPQVKVLLVSHTHAQRERERERERETCGVSPSGRREAMRSPKETSFLGKRDLILKQKRPNCEAKET